MSPLSSSFASVTRKKVLNHSTLPSPPPPPPPQPQPQPQPQPRPQPRPRKPFNQ
ncbi:hypothetical protein E2C01_084322 [Portunus trituberculatus]|uniref:Uncharacterized protein n=1 Tax=Portunus trituberculatus TaxID=210409 RepID=A0A5B7J3Y8_PORTR|nr:hypothetical protein [Portunus trituberculatus]